MFHNLNTLPRFLDRNLSVPGCWAHPDGLEVGNLADAAEDRAHFGAWAVTSSPLILAHDVNDDEISRRVWPIVANEDAIRINQQYVDQAGRLAAQWKGSSGNQRIQVWTKRLPDSQMAVFVINDNPRASSDTTHIAVDQYYEGPGDYVLIFDVWAQSYLGQFERNSVQSFELPGHDSLFFRFEPATEDIIASI